VKAALRLADSAWAAIFDGALRRELAKVPLD
jgi:hypothetical protein